MRYLLLLPLLIFVISCDKQDKTPPTKPAVLENRSNCAEFNKSLDKNPNYFKGKISVPEDYSRPDDKKIDIFYYGHKDALKPGAIPVAFFNGGPGGSSHSSSRIIDSYLNTDSKASDLPFIFIDQRGTGCSSLFPNFTEDPFVLSIYNADPSTDLRPSIMNLYKTYSSNDIVQDAENVRRKLINNRPWKVFGQSYGALIVHRYILDAPKSIVSAHAHGNVIGSTDDQIFFARIASQNRVLERYFEQYPDDREKLQTIHTLSPISTKITHPASGKALFDGIFHIDQNFSKLLGFRNNWRHLHTWLGKLVPNKTLDQDAFNTFILLDTYGVTKPEQVILPKKEKTKEQLRLEGYKSVSRDYALKIILTQEGDKGRFTFFNPVVCEEARAYILKNTNKDILNWPLHECSTALKENVESKDPVVAATERPKREQIKKDLQGFIDLLDTTIKPAMQLPALKSTLQKHPKLKFFLYSGELDSVVPRESFEKEAKFLGNLVEYKNFNGSGHDGFYSEPLVWQNLHNN